MADRHSQICSDAVLDRRKFLRGSFGVVAGSLLAESLIADPYSPLPSTPFLAGPLRVRGQVRAADGGIGGVAVSDGLQVVATAADGTFDFVTSSDRGFVHITTPSGYRIPTNRTGTARHHAILDPNRPTQEHVFDLERLDASDEKHALLLMPDPQTETAEEMAWFHAQTVPDVQATLRALGDREVFGIADGDIMSDNLELYPDYERAVASIGVPFFQVVGNHDLDHVGTDAGSTMTFQGHFGPSRYSFDRGAVHYVVLDDVFWHGQGYIGYLTDDALTWLRNDLALVEGGRTVIVATHIPALGSIHVRSGEASPPLGSAIANREQLYRLLEPYAAHILTGHTHENEHVFEHGTHEHVSGTVCGAWWSGPICWDGTPSGYSVYEIAGEEVTWRYKPTGKDFDHQLRVYPRGSDPEAPDEIVANVWDWDPEWSVVLYEDGARRGSMARRVGLDPLSVELHTGEQLPPHQPWVEPRPTGHLFYAPLTPGAANVTVEATDQLRPDTCGAAGRRQCGCHASLISRLSPVPEMGSNPYAARPA